VPWIDELRTGAPDGAIRGADGAIDYDHYRRTAQRERAEAFDRLFRKLAGRSPTAARAPRRVETPWLPEPMPRRP
jgi:hypothetical protein